MHHHAKSIATNLKTCPWRYATTFSCDWTFFHVASISQKRARKSRRPAHAQVVCLTSLNVSLKFVSIFQPHKQCHHGPVQQALFNDIDNMLGHGKFGAVYNLTEEFGGYPAVIKKVSINFSMDEVYNLQRVNQFLACGRRNLKDRPVYFIITKYISMPEKWVSVTRF